MSVGTYNVPGGPLPTVSNSPTPPPSARIPGGHVRGHLQTCQRKPAAARRQPSGHKLSSIESRRREEGSAHEMHMVHLVREERAIAEAKEWAS